MDAKSLKFEDLPEVIQEWMLTGEPSQNTVEELYVGRWQEVSSFDYRNAPRCSCCTNTVSEGYWPVKLKLAETPELPPFDDELMVCPSCDRHLELRDLADG